MTIPIQKLSSVSSSISPNVGSIAICKAVDKIASIIVSKYQALILS